MIWTALLLGIGGSLHCAGMCSPLALAVTSFNRQLLFNRFVYNTGRILVYGTFGALVATFGSLFNFQAIQTYVSIILGVLLILLGIGTLSSLRIPLLSTLINKVSLIVKSKFANQLKKKNTASLFILGTLNGILPCGLTYLALSYTLTLDTPAEGFLFMLLFGLGTFPVMIGMPYVLKFIGGYIKINYSKLTTVMMIGLGVLLIGRTMHAHHHAGLQEPLSVSTPAVCD
ncbi:sulfite exporter TauE/SafE family protein [Chryseotalea sanaruensis]|uniref:Sulfite exporter TauE/SafE family protein n=1 Tax=Chryseotalea sanaruensis TaxID=2482724 RepID=A0A401UEZ4_9BACT|nr:sulfite exporter TauE/SafE family protein [Chryseotalea sanaruensis]GCC53479.1 sulfite exporter TauE/SafE family protein [Chryseotalea sanaruensis]